MLQKGSLDLLEYLNIALLEYCLYVIAGVNVMVMQTDVMNTMEQTAPVKTTQRPHPASAVLKMIEKTATGTR